MVRKIIKIDESKCNGCGLCAAACHEGAIGMVNGKAKLLREDYCDGLGDCLPACPTGAITFEEREAPAYDHAAVLAAMNVLSCGKSYQEPGNWPGDSLVILEYGNGYTGMVTFMQTGEGVISAEASLAKDGEGNATALLLQLLGVGDGALEPLEENS
mgnify:CR=1 FL=1